MGQTSVNPNPSLDGNAFARRLEPVSGETCPNVYRVSR